MQSPQSQNNFGVTQAMIFAAGLGTRLKPWTDHHPKALAVVNNKTLLQRNVEYLQSAGIFNVVVNVHHFAGQIQAAVEKNGGWGSNIIISDESNEVLETGGGLMKAAPLLQSAPFVLINVDILTDISLTDILSFHHQHKPLATLATSKRKTSRYLLFNKQQQLCGWRNTATGQEKVNPNIYREEFIEKAFNGLHIIEPKLFALVNRQGKFSMIDVYLDLMNENYIAAYDATNNQFVDVGKPESIAVAEANFA